MNKWFECKVKFDKVNEDGLTKPVTESYLVDALSHAEAENRIIEEMKPYVSGELTVERVKKLKISELFGLDSDGDRWYKSKVNFVVFDDEKGVEKRKPCTMYAKADDIESALQKVREGMNGTMADYEIAAITETPVIDVYPYAEPDGGAAFYDDDTE